MKKRYFVKFIGESIRDVANAYANWKTGEIEEDLCKSSAHEYEEGECSVVALTKDQFEHALLDDED